MRLKTDPLIVLMLLLEFCDLRWARANRLPSRLPLPEFTSRLSERKVYGIKAELNNRLIMPNKFSTHSLASVHTLVLRWRPEFG